MEIKVAFTVRSQFQSSTLWLLVGIGVVSCLAFCCGVGAWILAPNARRYVNGSIQADANLDLRRRATYVWIEIGSREHHYNGSPKFDLKLTDGTIISFPDTDLESLAAISRHTGDPNKYGSQWPEDSVTYSLGDCRILVGNGKVLSVRLPLNSKTEIRTERVTRWYQLPMTQAEIEELFGPAEYHADQKRL